MLLAIVTLSYEQTIHAYPGGGGAYIVARDNLGELPAPDRRRGAADRLRPDGGRVDLVRRGADRLGFPGALPYRVEIAVALVLFIMLINLRGVKESGTTFAIPTYFFLVMMFLTVLVGLFRYLTGTLGQVVDPPPLETVQTMQAVSACS